MNCHAKFLFAPSSSLTRKANCIYLHMIDMARACMSLPDNYNEVIIDTITCWAVLG